MAADDFDPPPGTRGSRGRTWFVLLLVAAFLVAMVWFGVRSWGSRNDAYHGSFVAPPAAPARAA